MATKTILVTGGTGTVGQALVPSLVNQGYRVKCLVRDKSFAKAKQMFGHLFTNSDWLLAGDVEQKRLGLTRVDLNGLKGQTDCMMHLAAQVKFDQELAQQTARTNVDGTYNVLQVADEIGVQALHYMSTAYIAGSLEDFSETQSLVQQPLPQPRNAYESSKLQAEMAVQNWPGNWVIHRMSIIAGDTKTGAIHGYDGYYGFFKSFYALQKRLRSRWNRGGQEQEGLRKAGIRFDGDWLHLPLHMPCSLTSTLNLIPQDHLIRWLTLLVEKAKPSQVYHLVHPDPPRVKDVIELSLRRMKITGLTYGPERPGISSDLVKQMQTGLEDSLGRYLPYIQHGTNFQFANLQKCLGSDYRTPSEIGELYLSRVLGYALNCEFGRSPQSVQVES